MADAFILPDGQVQVSLSGGRTSAYMLHRLLQANGDVIRDERRVQVVFANTGREMPQTLDFVAEVGRRWSVPIAWVEWRDGEHGQRFEVVGRQGASEDGAPFEALIRKKKYLPNQQARFCTSELKVRTARDYLRSLGWEHWTAAIGLRFDEPKRWKQDEQGPEQDDLFCDAPEVKRKSRNPDLRERRTRWLPLVDAKVSKHTVALFWRGQEFDLGLQNVRGNTALGNFDGCFLKSEATLAGLARDIPERNAWWEHMEELGSEIASNPNGAAFSKRYTRTDLRRTVERHRDWIFDVEDGLCQTDDGECFA